MNRKETIKWVTPDVGLPEGEDRPVLFFVDNKLLLGHFVAKMFEPDSEYEHLSYPKDVQRWCYAPTGVDTR